MVSLGLILCSESSIEAEARWYRGRKSVNHGVRLADEVMHDRAAFGLFQVQCQA